MRKLLTGAVLLAATSGIVGSGVAGAATISGMLTATPSGSNYLIKVYLKTDTDDGTGTEGISGAQYDILSTTGGATPFGTAATNTFATPVKNNFARSNPVIEPASSGGYPGNSNTAAIGGSFSTNYADGENGGDPTIGTPGSDSGPLVNGYSLIATETWKPGSVADTLQLKLVGPTYFNNSTQNIANFDSVVTANVDIPVGVVVGPSLSLSTATNSPTTVPGSGSNYTPTKLGATNSFLLNGLTGHTLVAFDLSGQTDYSSFFSGSLPAGASQLTGSAATSAIAAFNGTLGGTYDVVVDLGAGVPQGTLTIGSLPTGDTLNAVAVVPEPTTISLLSLGAMALLGKRRRA